MTAPATDPSSKPKPSQWALINRMLRLGWQYRALCVQVLLLNLGLVAVGLAALSYTGLAVDVIRNAVQPASIAPTWPFGWKPPASWSPMAAVLAVATIVLVLSAFQAVIKYATAVVSARLSQAIVIQLRTDVYDKLQRLSFHYFDSHDSSSLINRVAGDVQAVRGFVDGVVLKVITVILSLAVYLAYMLTMHVTLALACLITTPLLWVGAVCFSRSVRPQYERSSELGDQLILRLSENVQGIQVVKGFAREADEIKRFRDANQVLRDQKFDIFWSLSLYQPAMGFLTQINQLILIGYGGILVVRGELPLGTGLFVFANLISEFANQVGQIINIANSIQSSLTGADRVFSILDAPIEIESPANAIRMTRARGEIEFDDVSFLYRTPPTSADPPENQAIDRQPQPNGPLVLKNINLKIRAGECVGIVGETGAGKTTLLQLIARFYEATSGRVLIDGVDVRLLDLHDLRHNIGFVFQESFLFSNTVAANIAFGKADAEMDQIQHAAQLADADEFITQLPEGYQSLIGEHGSNLSGGQRQRLAIARALLLDPPMLILDDATAAVDAETEHQIQKAIESAQSGRTMVLVSSRISSIRNADRIYVMQYGQIVESGIHRELMEQDGEYARLARLQLAVEFEEDPSTVQQRHAG